MITAHLMGLPIEESLPQLMPAGALIAAAAGIAARTTFDRVRRFRRAVTRSSREGGRS